LRPRLTTALPFSQHTGMGLAARTFPVLAMNASYSASQTHTITLGGLFPHMEDAPHVALLHALSHATLLPRGVASAMNLWRNFRELRNDELRRISIPRTPMNKGVQEGRSAWPRPSPSLSHEALFVSAALFF
jgi:hypothetical protein